MRFFAAHYAVLLLLQIQIAISIECYYCDSTISHSTCSLKLACPKNGDYYCLVYKYTEINRDKGEIIYHTAKGCHPRGNFTSSSELCAKKEQEMQKFSARLTNTVYDKTFCHFCNTSLCNTAVAIETQLGVTVVVMVILLTLL